ncbi:hypothetical protein E1A91_A09G035900v1 [Gossypium mustelinum]|uniref:Endonuclease/exonuclease/phosphatase domain-containing protein n=1 Tax=Gossypium mustelinum TaxID=34275 RepID=A0A5D2XTV2_GOSMU|nr:hypothetical protein E1A91_A09G035900v1 [Gossypium mustelinum]
MKILSWNCRGARNQATVRELKQLLVANVPDIVFLCETKIKSNGFQRICNLCRMEGYLAVDSEGKSRGLALMWRAGVNVSIQNYSKFHIDSLVRLEDDAVLRFTGFYGQTDSSQRQQAWNMLRRVSDKVTEGWIVGGDFNAILNDSEKEGGRCKPKILIEDFGNFLEELKLTDVKPCNRWFTWTYNREGDRLVKERLDRFVVSDATMEKLPFLTSFIIHQSKSDQEAIMMDSEGSRPNNAKAGQRAWFRYDTCWADEQELKDIISGIWLNKDCSMIDKMDLTRDKLGPWQYHRFRRMTNKIKKLEEEISQLMDGGSNEWTTHQLKQARGKLGYLYDVKKKYSTLRACSQWLREGDRNTRYFDVRASGTRRL